MRKLHYVTCSISGALGALSHIYRTTPILSTAKDAYKSAKEQNRISQARNANRLYMASWQWDSSDGHHETLKLKQDFSLMY